MCKQLFMCVCVYMLYLYMHIYKQSSVDLIEIYSDKHKNMNLLANPSAMTPQRDFSFCHSEH